MTETLKLIRYEEPFPHIIVRTFIMKRNLNLSGRNLTSIQNQEVTEKQRRLWWHCWIYKL
ncbi:MAG: hypothetical protein CM15mV26_1160 [uncultured marine virus]|nr:MAG: hypothetical protein CM15mV26_1160 [uncultured marine virus]